MNWQRLAGTAAVAWAAATVGCQSEPTLAPGEAAAMLGPLRVAAKETDDGALTVARSQQPDGDAKPPAGLLDLTPERAADLRDGQPLARIGATVGKESILNEEVLAAAYPALMAARDLPEAERAQKRAEVWNQAINQLIDREVVLQDAFARLRKNGGEANVKKLEEAAHEGFEKQWLQPVMREKHFENEEQLRSALQSSGLSLPMVRRQWERNFMMTEYLRNRIRDKVERIGPREVMEYYDKHPEQFQRPDSLTWQDLFIPERGDDYPTRADAHRFAETLAERVRKGEDFAALSEKYDKGLGAYRKGEGVGNKRGEIKPPEVENVLFQLKDGEAAVVELENGFHVVRVVKREYAGPTPFDEKTQKEIKEKLTQQMAQVEMKWLVKQLHNQVVIEYAH
jgi:hypothetical protein